MAKKSNTGKIGEDLASRYLFGKGYSIIERNYREKIGEIDVITKSPDRMLVFIEVKTLVSSVGDDPLMPEDNLTAAKLKKLRRTCELYANRRREFINEKKGWRIDLVAVSLDRGGKPNFRHYENIG